MIKKIWEWIKSDGLLHIETSALILILASKFIPLWIASIVTLLIGIGKELWDIKHGVPTWHDIICDIIGIVLGVLIVII